MLGTVYDILWQALLEAYNHELLVRYKPLPKQEVQLSDEDG